ncbi:MAG: hypothetical protein Fur005_44820 [Roseiflexaceae bacterium]
MTEAKGISTHSNVLIHPFSQVREKGLGDEGLLLAPDCYSAELFD